MLLFDTHCHLDEEAFEVDRAEAIARAVEAGVARILTIGTTLESSRRAVAIAGQFPQVWAAVGIQPNYASQASPGDWEALEQLASSPRVAAIGETGLDRYWDHTPFDIQVDFFDRHLALAQKLDLPFVVHCREAEAETVAQLQRAAGKGSLRGVMHSFTGTADTARACLALGLYISFAGMVTFKKSQALRELVAQIPPDRLLVETDAPYLAPQPMRGKRNEPAFLAYTAQTLADLLGLPLEEFARQTSDNAKRLFRIPLD